MPFGVQPKCTSCKTTISSMWRKDENDKFICNACSMRAAVQSEPSVRFSLRKSTRAKSSKFKASSNKGSSLKGRGRRSIFKTIPSKAPTAGNGVTTSNYMFYNSTYFQKGDIVSVKDPKECRRT